MGELIPCTVLGSRLVNLGERFTKRWCIFGLWIGGLDLYTFVFFSGKRVAQGVAPEKL